MTQVDVEPTGNLYRAIFRFSEPAPIWAFHRSALTRRESRPWRPDSWTVKTDGVTLRRIGDFDALVGQDGETVPGEVVVEFTPAAVDLIADYDPAVVLTDGTTALFSGVFTAFPVASREALAAMREPGDHATTVVFTNGDGEVFHRGRRAASAVAEKGSYAIYGDIAVAPSASVARIFDPALPEWLSQQLDTATPRIFEYYAERMGPHAGDRPIVLASWVPSDMQGISRGGSVLPGMITMRFEGSGLAEPDGGVTGGTIWFIAHEAAHFWLGETLRHDNRDRAWIVEGGADLMAMRATEALFPGFSAEPMIAQAKTDCSAALAEGGIEDARRRNAQRPYYACGSLFALAVERAGAPRGEDFFDFVAGLIASQPDGEIDGEEWLAAARGFGVGERRIALMRRLLAQPSSDPAADLDILLGG